MWINSGEDDDSVNLIQDLARRAAGPYNTVMAGLRKRSVLLSGHATSIALEPEFWEILDAMAAARGCSLAALIVSIDRARGERPLASACRVAAVKYVQG